jgi:hypothetical protein
MWPAPWLSGILVIRRSENSIRVTPPSYFPSGITGLIPKLDVAYRKQFGPVIFGKPEPIAHGHSSTWVGALEIEPPGSSSLITHTLQDFSDLAQKETSPFPP